MRRIPKRLAPALIVVAAVLIAFSHQPDRILHPQFWAEDGAVWFANAHELGTRALIVPYAGYLNTFPRLIALVAQPLPLAAAPLLFNLMALAFQILPALFFLSPRFGFLSLRLRMVLAFVYLALPNSAEVSFGITNLQWHLALLAVMVILADADDSLAWKVFDGATLVLLSLSSPMAVFLVPVAAVRYSWRLYAVLPGAIVECFVVLLSTQRGATLRGASAHSLVLLLSQGVFQGALLGGHRPIFASRPYYFAVASLIAAAGLAAIAYVLWRSLMQMKLFICYGLLVFVTSLFFPKVDLDTFWRLLLRAPSGNRYLFFPTLVFLAALVWIALRGAHKLRYAAALALLLLPFGIYRAWKYPRFDDLHFSQYADTFEHTPKGASLVIPINPPGWTMTLTKK